MSVEQQVMHIGMGYVLSSALNVAARLDIATKIGATPQTVGELAKRSGVLEDPLYRLLRALASAGVFQELDGRRFANTPASDVLRADNPRSLRPMIEFIADPLHFRTYAEMRYSIETGKPAGEKVVGMPLFEYFPTHPELGNLFNDAMTNFSASVIPAVLKAYDFSGIDTLVDVAGGHGMVLTSILKHYSSMRGVLFDMPQVIEGAGPQIASAGVGDRCQAIGGDFFKGVPSGDAYVMKHIIHDWDDDKATAILRNIRAALGARSNGRVLLLESVIHPGSDPELPKVLDLEMLLFPGGRERTADEFAALFVRAGFKLARIVPTESPIAVLEATPA